MTNLASRWVLMLIVAMVPTGALGEMVVTGADGYAGASIFGGPRSEVGGILPYNLSPGLDLPPTELRDGLGTLVGSAEAELYSIARPGITGTDFNASLTKYESSGEAGVQLLINLRNGFRSVLVPNVMSYFYLGGSAQIEGEVAPGDVVELFLQIGGSYTTDPEWFPRPAINYSFAFLRFHETISTPGPFSVTFDLGRTYRGNDNSYEVHPAALIADFYATIYSASGSTGTTVVRIDPPFLDTAFVASVPEPSSLVTAALGVVGLLGYAGWRRAGGRAKSSCPIRPSIAEP